MAEPDLQRWLDAHAIGLGVAADDEGRHTRAEPDRLREALSGARLIGVGEAVVGTRELVRLTHRLLEVLVPAGVRTLVLGAPEASTTVVDEVVARGEDPAQALESMADWRWGTGEVAAVLSWLAAVNAERGPADRLRLVGADAVSAAPAVRIAGRRLREVDPELLAATSASLHSLLVHRPEGPALPPAVVADAARVRARLEGDDAGDAVRRHAVAIGRAAELAGTPQEERPAVRDRLVVEAVTAAADAAGTGGGPAAVWWAHAREVRVRLDDGVPSIGARLRERFSRDYYALGLLVGQGEFRARRSRRVRAVTRTPVNHTLGAPPPDSVEATVAGTGPRLLDLRGGADREGLPEWVTAATRMRVLGDPTPVGWKQALEAVTPAEYDGLAHVPRTRQAAVR